MRPDRPYQTRALQQYRALVASGARRVLMQLPTGAGKTHLGLRCAEMATNRRLRVLWVAHRDELVDQPKARILAEGWPVDRLCVVKAGKWSGNVDAPITIASIQTLVARGVTPKADLVIFDEARHYVAAEWHSRCASHYRNSYLLGLDATPVRADGTPLGDLFDHLLVGATVRELVDGGHLVPHVVIAPAAQQDELAIDPEAPRDACPVTWAYQRHTPGQRAIVFCSSVHHAKTVAATLCAAGVRAESIDGKSSEQAREGALRRFMSGETLVITNVRILTEGTDLPPTEAIIHAARCGSLSDWIQKGGRGLRPSTGKRRCTILDLCGSVHEHGFLDDPHVYSLDGSGVRLADALPPIGQCPRCFAWGRSSTVCSACGWQLPAFEPPAPKVKAADLQEVRRADAVDVRRERLARWALQEMRAGRSAWRAKYRYRGTYGEDPPAAWMHDAEQEAQAVIDGERAARANVEAPLLARMGGAR